MACTDVMEGNVCDHFAIWIASEDVSVKDACSRACSRLEKLHLTMAVDVASVKYASNNVAVSISSEGMPVRNASTDVSQRNPTTYVSVRTAFKHVSERNVHTEVAVKIAFEDVQKEC